MTSLPRRPAVLIVEDESIVAHDLQQLLTSFDYDAYAIAASSEEALARAAEKCPDLALVDVRIKGRTDGIRTSQLLQERYGVPIVYLTAHADDATLAKAKVTQPYGYLLKPVNPAALRSTIEVALYRHRPEAEAPGAKTPVPVAAHSGTRTGRTPGARAVRAELERILADAGDFAASRRSRQFLRFIVEETLAGRGDALTQSAIATQAFGRKDDFDSVVDPIVRIQAGRLRRSLERYYLLSGRPNPVRIELPRGAYVPAFHAHVEPEAASVEPSPEPPRSAARTAEWPTVSLGSFQPASPAAPDEASAALFSAELVLELGRYRDVRTRMHRDAERPDAPGREGTRFSIGGALRKEHGGLRVSAYLLDHVTGALVWGDTYDTAPGLERWSGSLEDIARVIAARIGAEEGLIVQLLASEHKQALPTPATSFGAMLLAYEFFLARDPAVLEAAIEALQRAVQADPGCGPAWTRLARLFLANHNFELTPIPTPLEQAITYAHQGVRMDASSRPARCVLASVLLTKGELPSVKAELEEALRLSPDSLVYLEIIGCLLTLAGDWERGQALSRSALERNPHCLPQVLFGIWADRMRRGEIERAYEAALEYRDPTFFWRSVMLVSCLGHLGRDAQPEVAQLLRGKPDFPARGRALIGQYLKFPEVLDRVLDGLARAGVELA